MADDVLVARVIELVRDVAPMTVRSSIRAQSVLVGTGAVIDSMALLELLESIEVELGVGVSAADVALKNFSTIESLATLLAPSIEQ